MKNPITESPIIKNVCEVCGKVTYDKQKFVRICCEKEMKREEDDRIITRNSNRYNVGLGLWKEKK